MKTTTFAVQIKSTHVDASAFFDVSHMTKLTTETIAREFLKQAKQMFPGMDVRLVKREEEVIG